MIEAMVVSSRVVAEMLRDAILRNPQRHAKLTACKHVNLIRAQMRRYVVAEFAAKHIANENNLVGYVVAWLTDWFQEGM